MKIENTNVKKKIMIAVILLIVVIMVIEARKFGILCGRNEDDIKLRNRSYNMIAQDESDLANALEVVKGNDVSELTEQDYVLMATIFECGVENKNVDLINGVLTIANDWSVSNQMQVGEQWYIYGGPASAILSYIDPVKSGTAYYSYSMFLNIEREKPTDIVDPIIISYIDAGGALCFGAVDSYLFENGQYDIPVDNELDLPTYTLRYAARFVDMNEYMTESAMDNLKALGFSEEEIGQFYAGIGSDEDVRCVADLAELVPRALDEHWADEYWNSCLDSNEYVKLTHAYGRSVADYSYHLLDYPENGTKRLEEFLNGLLQVETLGDTSQDIAGVAMRDKRGFLLNKISNGCSINFIQVSQSIATDINKCFVSDCVEEYNRTGLIYNLYGSSLGTLALAMVTETEVYGDDFFGDNGITNCKVTELRISGNGLDYMLDYDVHGSVHSQECIDAHVSDRASANDIVDEHLSASYENEMDIRKEINHANDLRAGHITADDLKYFGKKAGEIAITSLLEVGTSIAVGDEVYEKIMYMSELRAFLDQSQESVMDVFSRYLGSACSYSINADVNSLSSSFICCNGNGPVSNAVLCSSIYSPSNIYMFDAMAAGAGVSDIDDENYGQTFDSMLEGKYSPDENEYDDYEENAYFENSEYLSQLYHGGFNMYEYMDTHTEEDFLHLCHLYNDINPDTTYDINVYFEIMNREWMSMING